MQAKDAIRNTLVTGETVLDNYIKDLDDADLLVRPVEGMNHIAWQLGHLLLTERRLVEMIKPGASPPLPEGFEDGHGRQQFAEEDASKYLPRARYQELLKSQREATIQVLDGLSDADLDRADPEHFPPFAPTVGAVMNLVGTHALMHSGQFVAVRRKQGKPITI